MIPKIPIHGGNDHDLPRVYLVRHGETAWKLTAQHTGRTNLPLTDRGEQASELGVSLAVLSIDRIFSSPLQRARRTAELAMPNSLGRRSTEIEIDRQGWRLFCDGCPNGETLDAEAARSDRVIDRIRSTGGNVLIFGHREILRILAARWIGLAPIEGRCLQRATIPLSMRGYDHDLTEPVIHVWNGRITAAAST